MQVSISHLICFVLVVFSVNVLVLAYLTGALSGMDTAISSLTHRLSNKLREIKFQRQQHESSPPPPWEASSFTPVTFPACPSGTFWRHDNALFCKSATNFWTETRADGTTTKFREINFFPDREEASLFDDYSMSAIVLKRQAAFSSSPARATSQTEALQKVFDNIYLKGGRWTVNRKMATTTTTTRIQPRFSPTDCTEYWSSAGQVAFCKLTKQHGGKWVELDEQTYKVKFEFEHELFHDEMQGVGIFDPERMICIVLLRTYSLIAYPKSKDQALAAALATYEILHENGQWLSDSKFLKIAPKLRSREDESTVLVMISAFHDDLCANTVRDLFENAAQPDRVRVAIIDQVSDVSCLESYCSEVENCRRSQMREIRVTLEHSRGVMFARFLQQTLIQDEEFCLQIDSHMVFPRAWDQIALQDWLSTENEMAVMTTYPNRAKDRDNQKFSPIRCNTVWNSHVVACGTAAHNIEHKQQKPHLTAFFGAGIAFSKCHANLVVPYDPWMAFLFKGEEYNRGSRLWTHGYDLYAPRKNYAYHFYDDDPRPAKYANIKRDRSFFGSDPNSGMLLKQSEYRWQTVMGMELGTVAKKSSAKLHDFALSDVEYFGLGTKRALREFELFSGINLAKHTAVDMCGKIGKMQWVPWNTTEHHIFGAGCNGEERKCCNTTMDRILVGGAKTAQYLNMTNAEFAEHMQRSGYVAAPPQLGTPILSTGWALANRVEQCANM